MSPDELQTQFHEILKNSFASNCEQNDTGEIFSLSETDLFRLWNLLGEELGIDLSLASTEQRKHLFEACQNGRHLSPRAFGSLLWLIYYSEAQVA